MPELTINGISVMVKDGATVLDAARALNVDIPTLCHIKDCEPETSCMLCVVKNSATGRLIPACSAKAVDGLEIETECDAVQSVRRDMLNLLLSEHVGDCEAPCSRICPAHLDIPRMLREIQRGDEESAEWIAKRDLAIPATLGHVCPAPCEKGCRRGRLDTAITIRDLHRAAGGAAAPKAPSVGGKAVAVMGAGAAGLSCAWKLVQLGHGVTVFDEAPKAGGLLREHETLPMDVLDEEVEWLARAGITFKLGEEVVSREVVAQFEGVVFAETEFSGACFTDAFHAEEHKLTVKAVANGKAAALALDRFLKGESPQTTQRFDSRIGSPRESEIRELEKNCFIVEGSRPARTAMAEAARCLRCDCRKPESCKLRMYAERYGADQRAFPADERGHVHLIGHDEAVVFEPGKCVKCGLCVKVTNRAGEELGVTFIGRGYATRVAVPFEESLQAGLRETAEAVVAICPTGALAFRDTEEQRAE